MTQPIVQVDAFTAKPFAGNPAGVCILPGPADSEWMQNVAREMNLSETAFLYREADGFSLHWFTPALEVNLCGHATLASAHVLFEEGHLKPEEEARFHTRSGLLTAVKRGDWIELDFPALPPAAIEIPDGLPETLGAKIIWMGYNGVNYLVEVGSDEEVRTLRPDIKRLGQFKAHGVIVTSRSANSEIDFVSRFFAPAAGVDEDPVTGSAHCCLGPYWATKLGKSEFTAYQASARGGTIRVRLVGDRVKLGGQAVTVLRGELL